MAHFYGTVQGSRGQAHRVGHATQGLDTQACSHEGKVVVSLEERDGVDYALVELRTHNGRGINRVLYRGPVGGLPHWRDPMQEITIQLRIDFDSANKREKEPIMKELAMTAANELITQAMMISDSRKPQISVQAGDHFHTTEEIIKLGGDGNGADGDEDTN